MIKMLKYPLLFLAGVGLYLSVDCLAKNYIPNHSPNGKKNCLILRGEYDYPGSNGLYALSGFPKKANEAADPSKYNVDTVMAGSEDEYKKAVLKFARNFGKIDVEIDGAHGWEGGFILGDRYQEMSKAGEDTTVSFKTLGKAYNQDDVTVEEFESGKFNDLKGCYSDSVIHLFYSCSTAGRRIIGGKPMDNMAMALKKFHGKKSTTQGLIIPTSTDIIETEKGLRLGTEVHPLLRGYSVTSGCGWLSYDHDGHRYVARITKDNGDIIELWDPESVKKDRELGIFIGIPDPNVRKKYAVHGSIANFPEKTNDPDTLRVVEEMARKQIELRKKMPDPSEVYTSYGVCPWRTREY
jgi:hypothetical protein